MSQRSFIFVLALIALGALVWVDYQERKKEVLFTSEGVEIRVLDAKSQGGVTRIVEPNGRVAVFSDQAREKELQWIAERQRKPLTQLDYSYHRLKRYILKWIED